MRKGRPPWQSWLTQRQYKTEEKYHCLLIKKFFQTPQFYQVQGTGIRHTQYYTNQGRLLRKLHNRQEREGKKRKMYPLKIINFVLLKSFSVYPIHSLCPRIITDRYIHILISQKDYIIPPLLSYNTHTYAHLHNNKSIQCVRRMMEGIKTTQERCEDNRIEKLCEKSI